MSKPNFLTSFFGLKIDAHMSNSIFAYADKKGYLNLFREKVEIGLVIKATPVKKKKKKKSPSCR